MRSGRILGYWVAIVVGMFALSMPVFADDDPWPAIKKDLFGDRPIVENDATLSLEAPEKAEDSAMVPISIRMYQKVAANIKSLTLVIDHNPSPVAARVQFGRASGQGDRLLSTRVRFDSFSYLRAIIETDDGQLHMVSSFVKAAGGCSSVALKDAQEAAQHIGEMRVGHLGYAPVFASNAGQRPMGEAQIMIRHPNTSGMQMDTATNQYIPARFVNDVEVKRGADLVFRMEAGISIATNPSFRFSYEPEAGQSLEVIAKDTDGEVFKGKGPPPSI